MATSMPVKAEKEIKKAAVELKNQSHPSQIQPRKAGGIDNMTKMEARDAIKTIKQNVGSLIELCYLLDRRKGYAALDYASFKECVAKELVGVVEYDYAIKLKNAGQVHACVCPEIPMGEVSEGIFRPLYRLPDATKRKVWNIAINKSGDYKKVTGAILKEIIKSKGLAAPAKDAKSETTAKTSITSNGQKDAIDSKIIINKKLQKQMRLSLLKLLKQDNIENENRPASKENFEAALNIILDDLFNFLFRHYDEIYRE
jgi:hypothetical protein